MSKNSIFSQCSFLGASRPFTANGKVFRTALIQLSDEDEPREIFIEPTASTPAIGTRCTVRITTGQSDKSFYDLYL